VFPEMEHPHRRWPRDWTRNQYVTVAQLCTGHSPLLAVYLPLVHTVIVLKKWQIIWCYTAGAQPGLAGVVVHPPLPKLSEMPVELSGEDHGGDPSPDRE